MLNMFPNASLSFRRVSSDGSFLPVIILDILAALIPMIEAR